MCQCYKQVKYTKAVYTSNHHLVHPFQVYLGEFVLIGRSGGGNVLLYFLFFISYRSVLSTTDGRIFCSTLKVIHLKLEHVLSSLSSTKSFAELWQTLTVKEEACTSVLYLAHPTNLISTIKNSSLKKFQLTERSVKELALVTPDSFLILVRIVADKNRWHCDIVTEKADLMAIAHSLLHQYSV